LFGEHIERIGARRIHSSIKIALVSSWSWLRKNARFSERATLVFEAIGDDKVRLGGRISGVITLGAFIGFP
jgi:hypothetical protein